MNLKLISLCLIIVFVSACGARQAARPDESVAVPLNAEELKLPELPPSTDAKQEKKTDKAEKLEKTAPEKKQEEQYVMLNFENADIETVVSTISDMLKINYILAPGVTGKITIQSHNKIPVSELFSTFQTVLEFNGFTAVKEGSFYRIVPIDTAKQQPVAIQMGKSSATAKDSSFVTQEIPLEYVKANDIANLVRNLMPRGTDIIVYEPSNMLIVTALPAGIIKLLKLLEAIDIPSTERDSVKTFIYPVENGEAKKLAEVLKNIYGKKGGSTTSAPAPSRPIQPTPAANPRLRTPASAVPAATGGATVQVETFAAELEGDVLIEAYDDINALIIKSSPRAYLTLLETIKRIDIQPKQVLIEVLIAEVTLDDTTKLGLEWLATGMIPGTPINITGGITDKPGQFVNSLTAGDTTTTTTTTTSTGSTSTTSNGFGSVFPNDLGAYANVISPGQFNALIYAAANKDKINVLASPHILSIDNKEATIEISDEVPTATAITTGTAGTVGSTATSQVQFKSVGTILKVTPHINEKKQVTLKISQEVSELGKKTTLGTSGEFQGFTTRKANTTAIVQNGHTLVIGGIIQEKMQKTRRGLPLLSEIPLLGYLFGSTTDVVAKKELVIMVTPHVVGSHEEADILTEDYLNKVKDIKKRIEKKEQDQEAEVHVHSADEVIKTE